MKKTRIIAFLLFFLVCTTVHGLGISPAKIEKDYTPGQELDFKLKIINNEHKEMHALVYAKGELSKMVVFEKSLIPITSQEGEKVIYGKLKTETISTPGTHEIELIVVELPNELIKDQTVVLNQDNSIMLASNNGATTISATQSVVSSLYIKVPYPGKYLDSRMYISEGQINQPTTFSFALYNLGKEKLQDIKGTIEIFTPLNRRVARIETTTNSLEAQNEGRIEAQWTPTESGEYYAVATVYYSDQKIELKQGFNVGNLNLSIVRIETGTFALGQIAKFDLYVENRWNKPVSDVFSEVQIFGGDGTEYTKFKTESVEIQPKAVGKIQAFWDTNGINTGSYDMKIMLHYAGQVSETIHKVQLNLDSIKADSLITAEAIAQGGTIKRDSILLLAILILVIVNIGWFVYMRRRNAQ